MAFRFRKSIKIAPGIKINLGKDGITSTSLGGKGYSVNIGKKGTRRTMSLPGTGISSTEYLSKRASTSRSRKSVTEDSHAAGNGLAKVVMAIAFLVGLGILKACFGG